MPKFNFTEEMRQEFKPCSIVDTDGVMQYGQFKGKDISEVPDVYLRRVVHAAVADAIRAQQELNSRSVEMLNTLVTEYPEFEDILVTYWEANHDYKPATATLSAVPTDNSEAAPCTVSNGDHKEV